MEHVFDLFLSIVAHSASIQQYRTRWSVVVDSICSIPCYGTSKKDDRSSWSRSIRAIVNQSFGSEFIHLESDLDVLHERSDLSVFPNSGIEDAHVVQQGLWNLKLCSNEVLDNLEVEILLCKLMYKNQVLNLIVTWHMIVTSEKGWSYLKK